MLFIRDRRGINHMKGKPREKMERKSSPVLA